MSTILVADSGSTKTDWAIIHDDEVSYFRTVGINPSSDNVLPSIGEVNELIENCKTVDDIHYYGAGVIDAETSEKVRVWLKNILPEAKASTIKSDMLGAAKATARDHAGIVSILGTGSNSCVFDGTKIIESVPALGYTLSNEGGGTEIGKRILQDYFYNRMPHEVARHFEQKFKLDKSTVVKTLYRENNPTRYLASFASYLASTPDKEWRRELLLEIFQRFIDIRIKSYEDYSRYELYFVGSIAYFCEDVLKDALENNNLQLATIYRKPIEGLVDYYKSK